MAATTGSTKLEKLGNDIQHAEMMMTRGIDIRNRRFVIGVPHIESNPENDVSFPFVANVLTAMDVLEFQYEYIKNNLQRKQRKERIEVVLTTFGGDLYSTLGIHDRIKMCSVPVDILVFGPCMSGGSIILQAGTRRFLSPHSKLMLHYGHTGDEGTSVPARVKEEGREHDKLMNQVVSIYMSRYNVQAMAEARRAMMLETDAKLSVPNASHTEGMPKQYSESALAENMLREVILPIETYLDPDRAVALGFADAVVHSSRLPSAEPILSEN